MQYINIDVNELPEHMHPTCQQPEPVMLDVKTAFAWLSEREVRAIDLVVLKGMSLRGAAEVMGCTAHRVSVLRDRGLETLRAFITQKKVYRLVR